MDFFRNLGRTEWLIGAGILAVALLVALPIFLGGSSKSARAELPLVVDSIRTAEITYRDAYGEYVACPPAPRAAAGLNDAPVAWVESAGFGKLHWTPPFAELVGSYEVQTTEDGFVVTGRADTDGDGIPAVYKATQDQNAARVTAEDVF